MKSSVLATRRVGSKHLIHTITLTSLVALMVPAMAQAQAEPAGHTPAADAAESKIPVLTRAQIDAYLAQPGKVLFIDVRRPDEVSDIGGFPAYLSIQISELDRFVAVIPRDRAVVVISNHAGRGQKGAELLAAKGFNVVGAIGAQNYEKEGGTLWDKKVVTPDIPGVVKGGTLVAVVREGFNGTEGPAVLQDGSVLFTENRADRIVKIAPNGVTSTYLEGTGGANALAINAKGELLAVETNPGAAGVAVLAPTRRVIASAYKGTPFVRPNDFALSAHGDIYVSDPGAVQKATQGGAKPEGVIKTGFYWINPKGKVTLVADDITFPNGVALSADEKTVYVADTQGEALLAFSVNPDGSLSNRREFTKLAGFKQTPTGPRSGADGIAVDKAGRVFVATNAGVEVFDADGKALGVIKLPRQPQNLVFGGPDHSRLTIVGRGTVYRIATLTQGPDRIGK
jgi:gluconolactonase